MSYKTITEKDAKERFGFPEYIQGGGDKYKYILLEEDTVIDGNLDMYKLCTTLDTSGIIVAGNLTVKGVIFQPGLDAGEALFVTGNLRARSINKGGAEFCIKGDLIVEQTIYGYSNRGGLIVEGNTEATTIFAEDHHFKFGGDVQGLIISTGQVDGAEADFETTEPLLDELADGDYNTNGEWLDRYISEGRQIIQERYISSGGELSPAHLILEEELAQLGNADIHELDLTGKKLKEFPRTLTKISSLKKLILDDNHIGSIPANIKDLVNLEELHLKKCNLESLPDEIGLLENLRVLDVSGNPDLQLPESINDLSSLRKLDISNNIGFGFPESVAGLKELEELNCYQCSYAAPIDFPMEVTQLTGLKKLFIGSNSLKTIPDNILQLENLEELNLDASLCYLDELPDLSKLKNLKTLHADGLISFLTRPCPKQSLLKSFFQINSLEILYLDRHGKRREAFIKKDQFAEIEKNLAHDPERFKDFTSRLNIISGHMWGDGMEGIVRENLQAVHLEGISNLRDLKVLDLSFNKLDSLPEEIFTLKHLQFLDLRYNRLPASERLRISRNLPGCTIDFRDNRPEKETADTEEVKQWQAMNKLITEANVLMNAKDEREKLLQSLVVYDEVLTYFSSGRVVDEYNLLYANYGKVYAYMYLTSVHKATFSPAALLEMNHAAIKQGLHTLSLIPSMIWHYTDLGKFHEEVTRITANSVAWKMQMLSEKREDLDTAMDMVLKAVAFIEGEIHYYIYDTQVRILLKLGRTEEAYQIVKTTLALLPDFGDFQDFKKDADYKIWLDKQV
ncbi:Leucine rich repeat-containing protein [Chitinophaga sp. YR573]|uniref:leucine-rich repeat domain-containing protein n=1 Tax=Chitinophaga sp. YR573 TaxID=1881040 RepID=UPI0008C189A3|nr:leucine-rich repeat domain-containing protein [Chitinophaga sp. YR573]SEW34567.1 Leucine rich repeat-containing protein [Chitinophaga sp. YR573]